MSRLRTLLQNCARMASQRIRTMDSSQAALPLHDLSRARVRIASKSNPWIQRRQLFSASISRTEMTSAAAGASRGVFFTSTSHHRHNSSSNKYGSARGALLSACFVPAMCLATSTVTAACENGDSEDLIKGVVCWLCTLLALCVFVPNVGDIECERLLHM